ncbi:MAG: glycosyltransferase family 2 protein [Acidobacteriota bacterium]
MTLSVVIPARNESASIAQTVEALVATLTAAAVPHEILVVDDHSTDDTATVLDGLTARLPTVRWIRNPRPGGYGRAVRAGFDAFTGDAVCIVMADQSDDPRDVVTYHRKLKEGYHCVFGSRFMSGARVVNYPWPKRLLNRLVNFFIAGLFGSRYTDWTNAFKAFSREAIDGLQPILACHFNLTVELPLKAVTRGYSYVVVPTNWFGRTAGASKLRLKEMGSRYLFVVLYVLLEKWLSRSDYRKSP